MNAHEKIKNVFKKVMYLNEDVNIDNNKSLFLFYDMSSVDFIDFSFEIRKAFNITSQDEHLWPIKSLMSDPDYCLPENIWTDLGLKKLNECLFLDNKHLIKNKKITSKELMEHFTIDYIIKRLNQDQK
ncbi:hypothetical protein [Morganella morganii]|uniref:hypothetical protein n=1 Tax=Morganella morganii TaxID=582 RepID=UPI002368C4C3|nr:hypothetical protein [Morganella morganii]